IRTILSTVLTRTTVRWPLCHPGRRPTAITVTEFLFRWWWFDFKEALVASFLCLSYPFIAMPKARLCKGSSDLCHRISGIKKPAAAGFFNYEGSLNAVGFYACRHGTGKAGLAVIVFSGQMLQCRHSIHKFKAVQLIVADIQLTQFR